MSKSTEACRRWRESLRKKYGSAWLRKKNAEKMRLYRQRKKLRKVSRNENCNATKVDKISSFGKQKDDIPPFNGYNTTMFNGCSQPREEGIPRKEIPVWNNSTKTGGLPYKRSKYNQPGCPIEMFDILPCDDIKISEEERTVTANGIRYTPGTVPFQHPFTFLVAGPTGCGKTTFVRRLLEEKSRFLSPVPQHIVWAYGIWQNGYKNMMHMVDEWVEGIPRMEDFNPNVHNLLILDDLMTETNDKVTQIFTRGSHHCNISVIHLVQNVFHKGKEHRNISLNTHYMALFKNPRDAKQITHLGNQMYPGKGKFFHEAFALATEKPFGYLLLDFKRDTPKALHVRGDIFDFPPCAYIPH